MAAWSGKGWMKRTESYRQVMDIREEGKGGARPWRALYAPWEFVLGMGVDWGPAEGHQEGYLVVQF